MARLLGSMSRTILAITAVLVLVQCLVPPWQLAYDSSHVHRRTAHGYGPIFAPPAAPTPSAIRDLTGYDVRLDLVRLCLQLAATAAGASVAMLLMRRGGTNVTLPTLSEPSPAPLPTVPQIEQPPIASSPSRTTAAPALVAVYGADQHAEAGRLLQARVGVFFGAAALAFAVYIIAINVGRAPTTGALIRYAVHAGVPVLIGLLLLVPNWKKAWAR